jgi:hypothetical protein
MRKNASKKAIKKETIHKSPSNDIKIEKILVENFIALQKVMTNLATKFDNLSDQISKLLEVFEISAKAMAEKDFEQLKTSDNKELLEKLDKLLEQNKIIAKGLTIIGEKNIPEKINMPMHLPEKTEQIRRIPNFPSQQKNIPEGLKGYQQSRRF